jgi:hypothetical protein
MPTNIPLRIQSFGNATDQALVLLHVGCLQAGHSPITPNAIRSLFIDLRLPPPPKIGNNLASLKKSKLAMQPATGLWAVTPVGKEKIRDLMTGVSDEQLKSLLTGANAEPIFGEAHHHLIPPELAPAEFRKGIGLFLKGFPFDSNVFGISRFPKSNSDVVATALTACREACTSKGLDFHIASDRSVDESLPRNVAASLWACRFGIAILENRIKKGLNYNVIFEVGAMIATGRRCLLLKDHTAPNPPTDLIDHIYVEVDIGSADAVRKAVKKWATETWGIG